MLFYYLILAFISIISLRPIRQKQFVFWGLMIILILIAGYRGPIDRDYLKYRDIYRYILTIDLKDIEFSFRLISHLANYLFKDVKYVFVIFALIGVSTKFIAIKRLSEYVFLSIAIYYSHYYILGELTQIRVGVATGFLLLSIPFIPNKSFKRFFFCVFFASFFHYSALVFLPFYFLKNERIPIFYYLIIPISYIVYFLKIDVNYLVGLIDIDIISRKYEAYLLKSSFERINVFNSWQLGRIFLVGVLLWKWEELKAKSKYGIILLKLYIWGCSFLVFLASLPTFAFRVSDLFGIVEIILIPYLVYLFRDRDKPLIQLLVLLIALIFLSVTLYYNKTLGPYFT